MTTGGMEYARELLYRTLGPEEAKKVLDKLTKSMQNTQNFAYLSKIKPQQLSDFITHIIAKSIACKKYFRIFRGALIYNHLHEQAT